MEKSSRNFSKSGIQLREKGLEMVDVAMTLKAPFFYVRQR